MTQKKNDNWLSQQSVVNGCLYQAKCVITNDKEKRLPSLHFSEGIVKTEYSFARAQSFCLFLSRVRCSHANSLLDLWRFVLSCFAPVSSKRHGLEIK